MTDSLYERLSRKERTIMDVVYRLGEAGVSEVIKALSSDEDAESVRVTMAILTKKGHLDFRRVERRNIYTPTVPRHRVRKSALRGLVKNFFGGSSPQAILAMLDISSSKLTEEDLDEIKAWIATKEAENERR